MNGKKPCLTALNGVYDLADYLGDDHDLAELRRLVASQPQQPQPDLFDNEQNLEVLLALINQGRAELEAAAHPRRENEFMWKNRLILLTASPPTGGSGEKERSQCHFAAGTFKKG
ncbi:MAG: hypothetical protein JW953_03560 [Anaerolineae bacterium]|nr:hypothetical protein [Anaerolineae bacterium]